MTTHSERLRNVSKMAHEEFAARGVRMFDVPARQMFEYDARGELQVLTTATHNRRTLAQMALDFPHCGTVVALRRSLKLNAATHTSLLYSPGCRLLMAVHIDRTSVELIGFCLVVNYRDDVLEPRHLRRLTHANVTIAPKTLYLELVCAKPHTGAATYLILRMLSRVDKQFPGGILTNPTNQRARDLFTRHQFVPLTPDSYRLTRAAAAHAVDAYAALLPGFDTRVEMCTRGGIRDARRTYWDCSSPR